MVENTLILPKPFSGKPDENFSSFLDQFAAVLQYNNIEQRARLLHLRLQNESLEFYNTLDHQVKANYDQLTEALINRYQNANQAMVHKLKLGNLKQNQGEIPSKFLTRVKQTANLAHPTQKEREIRERATRDTFTNGLK